MLDAGGRRTCATTIAFTLTVFCTAAAQYSGGTGEPNDPYQIATAADLIALGETSEDYDKHFILTVDIDLDPNLAGRKVFDGPVIAPTSRTIPRGWFVRPSPLFTGSFDGAGHSISHLTIASGDYYVGLFGQLAASAEVENLAVVDVHVSGSGAYVGGLVGLNDGHIRACYVTGEVRADFSVGGFAGGSLGVVTACYAQVRVGGTREVAGFVGSAGGTILRCYSTGQVVCANGGDFLGGFAGIGSERGAIEGCLWDMQASDMDTSACGIGFQTAQLLESDALLPQWMGGRPQLGLGRRSGLPAVVVGDRNGMKSEIRMSKSETSSNDRGNLVVLRRIFPDACLSPLRRIVTPEKYPLCPRNRGQGSRRRPHARERRFWNQVPTPSSPLPCRK